MEFSDRIIGLEGNCNVSMSNNEPSKNLRLPVVWTLAGQTPSTAGTTGVLVSSSKVRLHCFLKPAVVTLKAQVCRLRLVGLEFWH